MGDLPFLISRITPELFLIVFGSVCALLGAAITSTVYTVIRWRFLVKRADPEVRAENAELEAKLKETQEALTWYHAQVDFMAMKIRAATASLSIIDSKYQRTPFGAVTGHPPQQETD